ncbi:MAG: glutathione S-transferase N-terminal domain-containing protein [Woeseiaceae bacterium]
MAQMANKRLAMTLYSNDSDPYCHMVRIVLAEKGINYEVTDVDLDDTPEDLKDLNPYNEVPTLVDRDLVLYGHQVIMEYLDERFPHPPLMPVDPVSRARNRLMLRRIERDWYTLSNKIANGIDVDNARKDLADSLCTVAPIFEQKKFFMSDDFTVMDCAIAPMLWRLQHYGVELPSAGQPLITYAANVFSREAFKESLTEAEEEMLAI